ncbi:MAG: helix-turn-helix domain-containing protein [Clostridia bacterium]|nr:helix-turn-helix domain-containing protein [Clostridia bacterium]
MENETVGTRIATLRKNQGMTQAELSEKLNVTYQAVSKWERDESLPDLERLREIAHIFNVPFSYFDDGKLPENEQAQETAVTAAAPAYEPARVLLGVCTVCGKSIYDESNIAQTSPALVCKECHDRKIKNDIKAADDARKNREANEKYEKDRVKRMRNRGLITAGAICGALLILLIIGLIQEPTDIGEAIGGYCILVLFLFPFISQLFWHGFIVDVVLCGGKMLGGIGVIFTLDLDGIIFLIVVKLIFFVIRILFFLLTLVFFFLLGMLLSPFTFIPAVVKLSRGKELDD